MCFALYVACEATCSVPQERNTSCHIRMCTPCANFWISVVSCCFGFMRRVRGWGAGLFHQTSVITRHSHQTMLQQRTRWTRRRQNHPHGRIAVCTLTDLSAIALCLPQARFPSMERPRVFEGPDVFFSPQASERWALHLRHLPGCLLGCLWCMQRHASSGVVGRG